MNTFDRQLLNAWDRMAAATLRAPAARAAAVRQFEKAMGSQLGKPLRSWSLVVRANDTRIERHEGTEARRHEGVGERELETERRRDEVGEGEDGFSLGNPSVAGGSVAGWLPPYNKHTGELRLDKHVVARLCAPVSIDYPGVDVNEAAERFGVTRQTVWRWGRGKEKEGGGRKAEGSGEGRKRNVESGKQCAILDSGPRTLDPEYDKDGLVLGHYLRRREGRVVRDLYINWADRKRDEVRIWTRRPVDVGGEVFSADWGTLRLRLTGLVPAGFGQTVVRQPREFGRGTVWQWQCPPGIGCGRWVYKLYWPMPMWTIPAALCSEMAAWAARRPIGEGFRCQRCAGLVYESSERHWRPGDERGSAAVFWDRFVQRISTGMLRGGDVPADGCGEP